MTSKLSQIFFPGEDIGSDKGSPHVLRHQPIANA